MSAAVPYWWVIAALAVAFWELTWQMSGTDKAPVLSLKRVSGRVVQYGALAGCALFAVFFVVVRHWNLPVYGKVPAAKVLWTVLISPVNEELFFRGLMYRGFLYLGKHFRRQEVFEVSVLIFVAIVFAAAHARSGIFLFLTTIAGLLYGVCRWRSGSAVPGILCHAVFNGCVLWAFGR
jgi:membrane protease YdiL (CAAX protease family)